MPTPIVAKTASVTVADWVAAHAAAAPMNGAVQGVESTAVMMPNRNDPYQVSCFGLIM